MTKGQLGLDPAQVLNALRNEVPSEVDSQQQARLLSRIEASAALVGAGTTLGHAGGAAGAHGAGAADHVVLVDQLAAHLAVRPLATLLSTLVLGGALGVAGHATVTSRHQQAINATAVAGQVASPAPAAAVPGADQNSIIAFGDLPRIATALQIATDKSPGNQRANATAGKQMAETAAPIAPGEAPGLAEQLALLETARNAIRQRDAAAAMRALDSHAAQFPKSALTEEREALTIRALAMANRASEAKSRLARFETEFPGSLLLPSLKQTLGNYP